MAETALIGVDIDLSLVNRRLAETGELTAKEARQMQRELTQAFKQSARASEDAARQMARAQSKAARDAEREAKRAAREVARSYGEQASAVRGLFSAALGGVGGDLLDLADATDGVSDSMALLGTGLAALAIGPVILGELAQALQDTAQAGIDARKSLEEAGIAVERLVSPAALATLAAYEEQTKLTEQASAALSVELGSAAATDAQFFADAMLGAKQALADFSGAASGVVSSIGKMAETFLVLNPAFRPFILALRESGAAAGETKARVAELVAEQRELQRVTERTGQVYADTSVSAAEAFGADNVVAPQRAIESQVDETTAAVQEQTTAFTNLDLSMQGTTVNAGLTADAVATVNEQAAKSAELIGSEDKPGTFDKLVEDLGEGAAAAAALASAFSPILGNLAQLAAIEQRQHEARVQQLRDQRAESRETYRDAVNAFHESQSDLTAAEQAAQRDYLSRLKQSEDAKREQIREVEREEKRAAMEAFRRQKELQIAQATIDAARNAVVLTGALSFLTFGAPFVATGIALGQLSTQLAVINATPPPKFHFGTPAASSTGGGVVGIPGAEVPAVLEQGEGVVSRRGMATPGMAELVEAVNAGRAPTGRSMVTDIEADLLAQRLNRPYAPAIRGRALAGTNTFYRGR